MLSNYLLLEVRHKSNKLRFLYILHIKLRTLQNNPNTSKDKE
ncbi:hypothetical protein AB07_0098 [Citrobacter freundii]|nr:hypothetical protein AB07_0098 [Citrobacter freundii]